ncbi:lamin tail domain-containing protein [Oceaniferula flava]|nr:lamin tail domain-containing protein [Oceaniferula flavus]
MNLQAQVVISEFMAASTGVSLVDEDGESSDWLEIYNSGTSAVSMLGYHLTDDDSDLSQWTFPNVTIPAGGYLVVFASSKDRAPTSGELHTNFKLSSGGEYLALVDTQGVVLHDYAPAFPAQEDDISYGIGPDGVTRGFFTTPSPGAANAVATGGSVEDTQFSVGRGIHHAPISVEITSATVGAQIRYTTDGSAPTTTTGFVYTAPLPISQTTVLRAAAFKAGLFPSKVDTQSYLFPSDVRTQFANGNAPAGWPSSPVNEQVYDYGMDPEITGRYSAQQMEDALTAIPSVMLTTDLDNLTGAVNGIYSNAEESGRDWERVANIEFFGGDMTETVSSPCGIRIRGGASRADNNPKHSFRVFFRGEYGNGKLDFPLFEAEGVDEFDKIDFRTAQNYSWSKDGDVSQNTFLRDTLARDLQGAMGQPYTRSRLYHLYLNGIYWGLFMTQERAEANWGESYLGGSSDDYDAIKASGRYNVNRYDTEATDGDLYGAWYDLWQLTKAQLANPTTVRYYQMQGLDANGVRDLALPVLLDVDNLIDYMLLVGYTGAYDNSLSSFVGASNNWYAVRDSQGDRGFVHLMHDAEHTLGAGGSRWNSNNDRMSTTNGVDDRALFEKSNPQFIHMDLAESTPEYRQRFADRAHAALSNGGLLTKDRVLELLEARRQILDTVIIAESARWGDADRTEPADKENWESAVDDLMDVIETRTEVFIGHLQNAGLYPATQAPSFSPWTETLISGTSIQMSAPTGTVYYTTDGSDPRLPDGSVNPLAQSFTMASMDTIVGKNSVWAFDDSGTDRGSSALVDGEAGYNSSNWKHPDFAASGWSSGAGVLGFGALGASGSSVTPDTTMGDGTAAGGANPRTCYLRRQFSINAVHEIGSVSASVLADDGVIVYLNGVEVYRSNLAPGAIVYSDFAENAVGGASEIAYSSFFIDTSLLLEGQNTLAVEVHQVNAGSSDIGFDMDLSVAEGSKSTYTLNVPTYLNARVLNGAEWSALTSKYYSTGSYPKPGDLVISEVHYHPANPNTTAELAVSNDDGDFEFVELANVTNKYLELRGVQLAEQVINDHLEGVKFTFTDGLLMAPGQRISIVANRQAFMARYPTVPNSGIAGEYSGGLGNSSEWLQLRNSEGTVLASFRYNDKAPWPSDADGLGLSLQLANLNGDIDFSDPQAWMAIANHGSPSDGSVGPFSGQASADSDVDGVPAIVEYYSGSSDSIHGSSQGPGLALKSDAGEDGIYFTFTRDPEAFGVSAVIEQSEGLSGWGPPPAGSTLVKRVVLPGNLVRETYRIASGVAAQANLFVRLKLTPAE